MKLTLASVFTGAATLWREDNKLLLRLAGVLFFLPVLASYLFLPEQPLVKDVDPKIAADQLIAWWSAVSGWVLLQSVVQAVGSVAVLMMLLDRRRPTAGAAIAGAVGLLPAILIAWLATTLLTSFALLLLILPVFYATGRTFLVLPVLAAEHRSGIDAVREGIGRTRGHGWLLGAAACLPGLAAMLTVSVIGGVEDVLKAGPVRPELLVVFDLIYAVIITAMVLAVLLLQAATYRLLGSRQGI
jgi:hypothetical protein